MTIEYWHVDAFSDRRYSGNPASVLILDTPLKRFEWAQKVADEFNLPMNVFVSPNSVDNHRENQFEAYFFTPTAQVPLSGHGAISTCHTLWESGRAKRNTPIGLATGGGLIEVTKTSGLITILMPSYSPMGIPDKAGEILSSIGLSENLPIEFYGLDPKRADILIELQSADHVASFIPDFEAIRAATRSGLIISAATGGGDFDFVSRFFAPKFGLNEDWVTGIAHGFLFPYWAGRLGKTRMIGRQVSRRPGIISGRIVSPTHVQLAGSVTTVLKGELFDSAPQGQES